MLPQTAWRFHTREAAVSLYPCHWDEVEPGVWRFFNDPVSGIGSSGYLIQTPDGNLAFEGCAVYSDAALDQIARLGGVKVLAASHPHSYGAIWQLQTASIPNSRCIPATSNGRPALCVSWPFDERLEPIPGLELHLTAGHFRRPHHSLRPDPAHPVLRRRPEVRTRSRGPPPRRDDLGP